MEAAREVPEVKPMSEQPAVRSALKELATRLGNNDLRAVRQAPQLLVSQVEAIERMVLCSFAMPYVGCSAIGSNY